MTSWLKTRKQATLAEKRKKSDRSWGGTKLEDTTRLALPTTGIPSPVAMDDTEQAELPYLRLIFMAMYRRDAAGVCRDDDRQS